MADLTKAGTSDWSTGITDTATVLKDDPSGDQAQAENVNGVAKFCVDLENAIGAKSSLVGNKTDLATRLAVAMDANGVGLTTGGGTALTSYTTGDTLYSSATNTLAKLAIGTTNKALAVRSALPAWSWLYGLAFVGPINTGTGSTYGYEGAVTVSGATNLSGVHFYSDFTLNSSTTITVPARSGSLWIIANNSITINGTITGSGAGLSPGGAAGTGVSGGGGNGGGGTDQPGGGGGSSPTAGGNGGGVLVHGITLQAGGAAGNPGGAGTSVTSSASLLTWTPYGLVGGASGGGGATDSTPYTAGAGGAGGASIVLIAPTITLAATSALNTAGAAGGAAAGGTSGSGGGGGAGNIYILCSVFTNNGCTFTQTGGAGGSGGGTTANGGAGANGHKQIILY